MNFLYHTAYYAYNGHMYSGSSPMLVTDVPLNILAIILVMLSVSLMIAYIILSLLLSRMFKKAGVAQWIAWVPFYNIWTLLELGDQKGFWAVLLVVPFISYVAIVFLYIAMYRIGLKFGKESWFVLLAIFIPIIWYGWLALDDSKWHSKAIK